MARPDWRPFLERFSREVLDDERERSLLPPEVVTSGWLGFAPATEAEIAGLEERIGARLPDSYRNFLQQSNGWRTAGAFIYDLLPTSQVNWFRLLHQDWIDAWTEGAASVGEPLKVSDEEYFVYDPAQNCCKFRDEYWHASLAISGEGDSAIYLLNPMVVDEDGEWEAWFFSNWNPGAVRYRSFWEMMQDELECFVRLRDTPTKP